MYIDYRSESLRKLLTNSGRLQKKHGAARARLIMQRITELGKSDSLHVFRTLPGPRCEELKGNLKGKLSARLDGGNRLIFEPTGDDILKPDGGLDWSKVKSIRIVKVEDYHD